MAFFNNKEIVFGKNEHGYEKKLIKKRRTIPVNYPTTPGKKVWFEKKYPRKEKFTTKLKTKFQSSIKCVHLIRVLFWKLYWLAAHTATAPTLWRRTEQYIHRSPKSSDYQITQERSLGFGTNSYWRKNKLRKTEWFFNSIRLFPSVLLVSLNPFFLKPYTTTISQCHCQ